MEECVQHAKRRDYASNQGFTLVELAIVLLIGGFLVVTFLGSNEARTEIQRIKNTQLKLKVIIAAIEEYARNYQHLPCPADPTLDFTNANFGDGLGTGGNGSGNTECLATNMEPVAGGATDQILRGAIPTDQLGLTTETSLDGWGRRFSYVVAERLTMAGASGYSNAATSGLITIQTNHDGDGNNNAITSTAAVIVFSHGPNGFGARTTDGSSTINTAGITNIENENLDADTNYVTSFPRNDVSGSEVYDDILKWRSRFQMVEDE